MGSAKISPKLPRILYGRDSFIRLKNFRLSSFRYSVQTGFRTIQVENQWSCFTIFGVPIRLCAFGGSASIQCFHF